MLLHCQEVWKYLVSLLPMTLNKTMCNKVAVFQMLLYHCWLCICLLRIFKFIFPILCFSSFFVVSHELLDTSYMNSLFWRHDILNECVHSWNTIQIFLLANRTLLVCFTEALETYNSLCFLFLKFYICVCLCACVCV